MIASPRSTDVTFTHVLKITNRDATLLVSAA
jgi:hypothetical protein